MKIVAVLLASLSLLAIIAPYSSGESQFKSHEPISIDGNEEFIIDNGLVGGNGTFEDPYIISGWEISVQNGNAIKIENTSDYVVIRSVKVTSEKGNGIKLFNVSNMKIENVEIVDNTYGIYFNLVSNINISTSIISRNYIGVYLYQWSYVELYWNAIRNKDSDIFNDDMESINVSNNWFGSGTAQPKSEGNVVCERPLASEELFKTVDFRYDYSEDGSLTLGAYAVPEIFISGFEWDLGDGNNTDGREVFHDYALVGEYNITLRVWSSVDGSVMEVERTVLPGTSYSPPAMQNEQNELEEKEGQIAPLPVATFLIAAAASFGLVLTGYVILRRLRR